MRVEKERVDAGAPQAITDLFALPYAWVATMCQSDGRILDVGGGEARLGHAQMAADDIDVDPALKNTFTGSILALPFKDREYDLVMCFETIEHVDKPLQALAELVRVTDSVLVVGSVNSDGPNFVGRSDKERVAIWKGSSNEFHLSEMGQRAFAALFGGLDVAFYSSIETVFPPRLGFTIVKGLVSNALVNYAVVQAPPR